MLLQRSCWEMLWCFCDGKRLGSEEGFYITAENNLTRVFSGVNKKFYF